MIATRTIITAPIRFFLTSLCAALACCSGDLHAADNPPNLVKTYVYKQVGDVKLEVDVYRAADAQPRPVLIFLHGGALIMGNRKGVPQDLNRFCQAQGYCFVSVEYRLAPETKLPQIIEDLRDAIKWVSEKGPEVFGADASKVAVAGQSAGGYLTMMAGLCEPRPKALISYWGYGDVDGDWYTKPSEFYRTSIPLITKEDAYKAVNLDANGAPLTKSQAPQNRGQYYRYLRQNGLWTKEVSGFDPAAEPRKLDPYCPVRNVTDKYPPIVMIHGTADTDVPCQESKDMAEALKKSGVRHELILIEGAGHGLGNGDKKKVADAYARATEFIKEHLGTAPPPAK